jgi:hypothetical protein
MQTKHNQAAFVQDPLKREQAIFPPSQNTLLANLRN